MSSRFPERPWLDKEDSTATVRFMGGPTIEVDTGVIRWRGPKLHTMSADEFVAFLDVATPEEIEAAVTDSQFFGWGS